MLQLCRKSSEVSDANFFAVNIQDIMFSYVFQSSHSKKFTDSK